MDSSINRVDLVLGKATVAESDIKPEEWLEIINAALDYCKPFLKYFPGFKPIGELLNCNLTAYDDRATKEDIVGFPDGISSKTRCVDVYDLDHATEGSLETGFGVRFFGGKAVLLTQEGKWLIWSFRFERRVIYGLGYREHRYGIREVASLCKFSLPDNEEFCRLLSEHTRLSEAFREGLGRKIIQTLCLLSRKGVEERTERLNHIKSAAESLAMIQDRIR